MEEWRTITIPGLSNYQVSNLGNVRNTSWRSPGRIRQLTPVKDKDGYLLVCLSYEDGRQISPRIHRLVAMAFLPNPDGLEHVNHKDENKANNRVDNLEWMTCFDNNNYGTRNVRLAKSKLNTNCKQVRQLDLKGNLIRVWKSVHEVNRQLGYDVGFVARCCTGKCLTAYGWKWDYEVA